MSSRMFRKKKVSSSVRMWAPSTSASAMSTMRWYRAFPRSNSSPIPVPIAVMSAWISWFSRTLCSRAFSTFRILPRIGRIAWLARQPPALQERLPSRDVASLLRRHARLRGRRALRDDPLPVAGVLLEPRHEVLVHRGLDERAHGRVAELRLRLALELRIAQLHRDDRREALAHVLTEEVVVLLLQQPFVARVAVHDVREGLLQSLLVHPALMRVDRVRERVDRLGIAGVPLQGDLGLRVTLLDFHVDDTAMQGLLAARQVLHEVRDATAGLERLFRGRLLALVDELDLDALGEEGLFLEPLGEQAPVPLGRLGEDLGVRPERDDRAALRRGLALRELARRFPARVRLAPRGAAAHDQRGHLLRECVHHRDPDAVQAPRDPVALAPELPARVQRGEHDLDGRTAVLRLGDRLHGDAPAVVLDLARAVLAESHDDPVAEARHRLVDRVVDDLVHEVVEAADRGRPDVHARAQADVLDALEDLDVLRLVVTGLLRLRCCYRCQTTSTRPGTPVAPAPFGGLADRAGRAPQSYQGGGPDDPVRRTPRTLPPSLRYNAFRGSARTTICTRLTSSPLSASFARFRICSARKRACAPHGPVLAATTSTPCSRVTCAVSAARR